MVIHRLALAGMFALSGLLGCAASNEPAREIGKAEVAVRSADEENATEAAGLDMRMAREKLERAKAAMRDEEYDKAQRLAEEASVDAELARVKAQSESAQSAAAELQTAIQSLRNEAQRGVSTQ